MDAAVKADFNYAKNYLESAPHVVSQAAPETKLKLYGLYKQATCGDCTNEAPSMFNLQAKVKHDAWKSQAGLSMDDAGKAYVKTLQEVDPTLKMPSHRRARHTSSLNVPYGSNSSLSALVRSESKDFLDRLLGAPPRLSSPAPSALSEHVSPHKGDDVEEKSSTGSGRGPNNGERKKKLSLGFGKNSSLEELKKIIAEEPISSSSSVVSNSAPATPQGQLSSGILKMRKSSSLSWGKAEDYTPLITDRGRMNRRRKSEGDDFEIGTEDDPEEESSNMDWDSDREEPAHNLYLDDEDTRPEWDDDDEYGSEDEDEDEEDDEYGESKLKRKDDSNEGGETFLGTMLFTMPFVVLLKWYQLCSSVLFLPVTAVLSMLGFRVEKAPDTYSVREKKQAASLFAFASLVPLTPVIYMWTFFFLIFPFTTLPTAAYIAWMLYWDESARDGHRRPILRDVPLARYFCEYFPITLTRRSPQLDPEKKYVFAYHPHGIIGLGSFGAFATNAAGFKEKFPGLDIRLLTLDNNLKVPILREILLGFGVCSCSRKSCDAILNRGAGSAICLVVGGAAESLETQTGTYRLVLGRKGFVQVAVENDADLVPVIAFGETDAFETFSAQPGTILRQIQGFIQQKLKFTVPIFWGRGMFNTNFGMMPKRRPIQVVTGEPLSVKPFRDRGLEGEALVEAMHKAYIAALRRLFDENKDACEAGIKRKESLTIIK